MVLKVNRCHLLWLIACMILRNSNSQIEEDEFKARIPTILQSLCPGSTVCGGDNKIDPSGMDFMPEFAWCCEVLECSCHPDCEEKGNCCFPLHQNSRTDDNNNKTVDYEKSCLSLTIESLLEDKRISYQKYNMITSVYDLRYASEKHSLPGAKCGNQRVAPWGSFFPVFSKIKNRLYKNMACATLDGSSDAIEFDMYIICERCDPNTLDLRKFVENEYNLNSKTNKVRIDFRYPGDTNDLKWHLCFMDFINSCPATFAIQAEEKSNYTQKKIITRCGDGHSLSKKLFANAFCHACTNDADFGDDLACTNKGEAIRRPAPYKILIDTNFISNNNSKDFEENATPMACRVDNADECRLVYCPSGQLYNSFGQCNFPSKMWLNPNNQAEINLTSERRISKSDSINIREDILIANFVLKSPWPKNWYIKTIYVLDPDWDDEYISFLVTIQNKLLKVRPHDLIRTVKKMIHRRWTLKIANKTFILASDFSPFFLIQSYEENNKLFVNQTKKMFYSQYHKVYIMPDFLSRYHTITKLYFCSQVELASHEFILNSRNDILYNIITNRYLFWYEFQVSTLTDGKAVAKVCIEESGLKEVFDLTVNVSVDSSPVTDVVLVMTMISLLEY